MQENTRTKKQLAFANKQLINKGRIGGGGKENGSVNQSATTYQDYTA